MSAFGPHNPHSIKKYSNRRFYDATISRNVTLTDLYEMVCAGTDVRVTDSTSGADITNAVLLQMVLERDADKLFLFPPAILHQLIRTQQQFLGPISEGLFQKSARSQRTAYEQWARFMRDTFGFTPPVPADWSAPWLAAQAPPEGPAATAPDPPASEPPSRNDELDRLRRQLAELGRRVEELSSERDTNE
jgi:polyhydroxyalkanoate synthesis repressor PhaR